ncbi:hypothetical protein [Flavihumibacter profundi]|uniref:hypothetical protein n=1 Tax=Flavihumibacter profundi TaxID=2716883 RepID=UPI001CC3E115|nr:hypothetical protein [Flavihumibacter profundi]MBZ5856677.1 hypothetical protein [Flavihumibacter profundi]
MKKLWLILAAVVPAGLLQAQKVDLDRYEFTAAFRDLPKLQIDSSFHTFDFTLETGPLMKLAIAQDHPEESLEIEGWRRLPSSAHISVNLRMEDLIIVKTSVDQREELKKDKNGNITSRKLWYAPLITYTYGATVSVKDYTGKQLQQYQAVTRNDQYTYKGVESGSQLAAANILLNMFTITALVSRDVCYRTINQLSGDLSDNYGYIERRNTESVWLIGNRKHPEYDDFRANWAIIKNALFRMTPSEPLDGIKEEVKPAIAYFEKIRKEYSSNSKGDRKLRYATYYLLAKLYYYLDDPDNGVREATGLILNDYDARDGKGLEEGAIRLKSQLSLNKRKSRHFPLDVYSLQGPHVHSESLYSVQ